MTSDQQYPTREQLLISGDDLVVTSNGVTSPQLRKRLKDYYAAYYAARDAYRHIEEEYEQRWEDFMKRWEAYMQGLGSFPERPPSQSDLPPFTYPSFPEECHHMVCGAVRKGIPCKQRNIYPNGRCKFHGGLSTGPVTPEGKRRSAMNGNYPKKKRTS